MEKPKTVNNSWNSLVAWVLAGKVRAMARMITLVEAREPGWKGAMKGIYSASGSAKVIGITGPPGAGKSSLTC